MQLTSEAVSQLMQGGFSNLPNLDSRDWIDGKQDSESLRQRHDSAMETYEMAKKIYDVFSTGAGPEVLAFYKRQTLERVQFNPELKNPEESGFFQSGEANIVLHIVKAMTAAEKGPPEMPSELMVNEEGGTE